MTTEHQNLIAPVGCTAMSPSKQTRPRTVAVLQPGYLPWLGFFDQMSRCDVFVLYDDVQFDKNGWRNRNRIKSSAGPLWLSVPVKVNLGQRIIDVRIDNTKQWARKHVATIRQNYKRALFVDTYLPTLERLLNQPWENLVDLDVALILQMREWLGIESFIVRSSQMGVAGDRNERLINLCLHFGAARYLSGNAAQCYLDVDLFNKHGIEVAWQDYSHPVYPQIGGDFVPYLSTLDLLLNCGEDSGNFFSSRNQGQQ